MFSRVVETLHCLLSDVSDVLSDAMGLRWPDLRDDDDAPRLAHDVRVYLILVTSTPTPSRDHSLTVDRNSKWTPTPSVPSPKFVSKPESGTNHEWTQVGVDPNP